MVNYLLVKPPIVIGRLIRLGRLGCRLRRRGLGRLIEGVSSPYIFVSATEV